MTEPVGESPTGDPGVSYASDVTEAARLRARGVPITLEVPFDGIDDLVMVPLFVRFNYSAIEQLEAGFGSLEDFAEALNAGQRGPMLRTLRLALEAGLSYQHDVTPEQIRAALKLEDLETYAKVVGEAFEQSFPQSKNGRPRGEARGRTSGSPGGRHTISPRSRSGARTKSSGG